jgi:hypothetical protein
MGADWVRRAEQVFRHCLQEASSKGLNPIPLFPPDEDVTVTYPCHWLSEGRTLEPGTRLTIFERTEKSRVAVLHGSEAVGEVRGEAARDLKELFRNHPELCNTLAVTIVRVGRPTEPFYVQPVAATKKKAAAQ